MGHARARDGRAMRAWLGAPLALTAALLLACASGPASGPGRCPPAGVAHSAPAATPTGLVGGDGGRGAALFAAECARCHSHDVSERGSRLFRGYPRLDCAEWLATVDDGYLFRIIAEGGEALGRDPLMKPFAEQLSHQEISDLVAFVRASGG